MNQRETALNIRWDATLVAGLARELDHRLRGRRVRAIRLDGNEGDVDLFMREGTLRWRLHPSRGSVSLMGQAEQRRDALRLPVRIRRVYSPADERVLTMECLPSRAGFPAVNLVFELIGNRRNCLVVEVATGMVRHELRAGASSRRPGAGDPYSPVSRSLREGTDGDLSVERFGVLMEEAGGGDGTRPGARAFTRAIVGRLAWSSAINARVLLEVYRREGTKAAHRLWRRLADAGGVGVASADAGGSDGPVALTEGGTIQPYPLALPGMDSEAVPSLLEAFRLAQGRGRPTEDDRRASGDLTPQPFVDLELLGRLAACQEVLERRLARLERELDLLEDPAKSRALGDLILARYDSVPAGVAEAVLDDPGGVPVTVRLEPGAPPHVSAERYYRRAAKLERAASRLPALVERGRRRLDAVRQAERQLRRGEVGEEAVGRVLEAAGVGALDVRGRHGRADKNGRHALPYRTFRSSGGLDIRVGLGARRNDELTFRHSSPHDVWLHARHASGAHVILRWPERDANPPASDLNEAAGLAALHSRARTSGVVPVDWTRRRHVRKPRGSPPGAVVPDHASTVFVRPDPALAEALRVDGGA